MLPCFPEDTGPVQRDREIYDDFYIPCEGNKCASTPSPVLASEEIE